MSHPCQYSPEVIDALRPLIQSGEYVHDPFAGTGVRLGALCNEVGAHFSGADIESWPDKDPRVWVADATGPAAYPPPKPDYTIITSPVYLNKRLCDYPNGPLATTKTKGRRDYGIALGRALQPGNLARHTGKPTRAPDYWRLHSDAIKHWPDRALVNVDSPIGTEWCQLLELHGYQLHAVYRIATRRYRGLANADIRADHEILIAAQRPQ